MTKNKYGRGPEDTMNGEEGIVQSIADDEVVVVFGQGENTKTLIYYAVPPDRSDPKISDLRISFARTIHTAQGSEYPTVIVWISRSGFASNLFYTAITRAQQELWLVGNIGAMTKIITTKPQETHSTFTIHL